MRHGPASSSAARSRHAARASHRIAAHSRRASSAARIARSTVSSSAAWNRAITCLWRCGIRTSRSLPVRTCSPPTTHGISTTSRSTCGQRRLEPRLLRAARCIAEHRLVDRFRNMDDRVVHDGRFTTGYSRWRVDPSDRGSRLRGVHRHHERRDRDLRNALRLRATRPTTICVDLLAAQTRRASRG